MKKEEKKIPVQKNQHYTMEIDDLGTGGEGIGKIEGYTLFVPGALPQETIEVRVVKTKKNYGFGKLISIQKPSPFRVEPVCSSINRCGGCQLQHLNYAGQLEYKQKKVKAALQRIGGFESIEVKPTIGMNDEPYGYRNKGQFPVGSKNGEIQVGFYAARSHDIINIQLCHLQQPVHEEIIGIIKNWMRAYNISSYDERSHRGLLRHIMIRTGYTTKQVMVCLVINGEKLPHAEELAAKLKTVSNMTGIILNSNEEKTNVILGKTTRTLWGQNHIVDSIGDIEYKISPLSFYQVNPEQAKKLYDQALAFADLKGSEILWDAYCGIGTISLYMAKKAKKVYGVEIVPKAIEDAKANAELNNIENVEFYVGKAEEVIPRAYEETGIRADVIVVDPPRKGCDERLLETILKMKPERVVYVSCDPGTLARDLKYLCGEGKYEVGEVQPVDMFPMTVHVETVVKLQRRNP